MIKGNHLKCGHQLKVCSYCLHTGCDYSGCSNSIGGAHTTTVCEMCGNDGTEYMENYQYAKQARAQELKDERENNLRRMEQIESDALINRSAPAITSIVFAPFKLALNFKYIVLMGICSFISMYVKYTDFTGFPRFIVGTINFVGEIASFLYTIVSKIVMGIINQI